MHLSSLAGKSVCIIGYGKEGQAMAQALKYIPGCRITVADRNPDIERSAISDQRSAAITFQVGSGYLDNLERFNVIIKSPGIPPNTIEAINQKPKTKNQKPVITSPTQIFFDTVQESGAMIIGVTGSKGKSTTSTLIHSILQDNSRALRIHSHLIGNIGEPAISHIEDAGSNTIFVLEMSSYQLMDLTSSPFIAVITSFFPEHLDYHGSLANYLEAKKHITRFQTRHDVVFYNAPSKECEIIAQESSGRHIPFSADDAPVTLDEVLLKGEHNLSNIAAAYQVALHLGVEPESAIETIRKFRGLPHRLQSLGIHHGFEWIDDSISTTPQSAIAALDALGENVTTIILGGQDRGYDFSPLAKRLKNSKVTKAILLPDSGPTIGKAIRKAKAEIECVEVETIEEVVGQVGSGKREAGSSTPIVLLSPSAPSYGHFKNFEERGERFKAAILNRKITETA
ncbi:MAG: UDP-N-acetylmuramoyl-L-alanine--D-glutamate ligase [Candidatus Peribacteraceae bacterium]|nr:UDP-N-acetylmuramoyl-L-alanine--D-glutamate ligase [Candidatus Peribacteraceae bacterium]